MPSEDSLCVPKKWLQVEAGPHPVYIHFNIFRGTPLFPDSCYEVFAGIRFRFRIGQFVQ